MVRITIGRREVTFEPLGWSKVWTLRTGIQVPIASIRSASHAPADIGRGLWKGWRVPGTHVPNVFVAGSYYRGGSWEFWDVRVSKRRAIIVELENARYRRLIVDVSEPAFEVDRLRAAMRR